MTDEQIKEKAANITKTLGGLSALDAKAILNESLRMIDIISFVSREEHPQ